MSAPESTESIAVLLRQWLTTRLDATARTWLDEQGARVAGGDKKALYLAFGLTSRKVGKGDLSLSATELDRAAAVRPGWDPRWWTVEQAARAWLLLRYPSVDGGAYVAVLDQLFAAGEMHELVALYQALPLLPQPAAHQLRCAEGIRTNIRAVFDAIAHRNPYPAEALSEPQWNQLILKCLFVGAKLEPVLGLDQRHNVTLARILCEFAHERWAAGRPVSPELWRCVGPVADEAMLPDLQRVLSTGTELERQAAALALRSSALPQAAMIVQGSNVEVAMTWGEIAAKS
jgi:hypothetical protein